MTTAKKKTAKKKTAKKKTAKKKTAKKKTAKKKTAKKKTAKKKTAKKKTAKKKTAKKKTAKKKTAKKKTAKKKTAKAAGGKDATLAEVYAALRGVLRRYEARLDLTQDTARGYSLQCKTAKAPNGSPMFFASVVPRKNTVNFYLMPVYVHPVLLRGMSPELRKRMQGKSCFNFAKVDPPLFKQLAALTKKSFEHWRAEGMR